jgi:hypothetical protein
VQRVAEEQFQKSRDSEARAEPLVGQSLQSLSRWPQQTPCLLCPGDGQGSQWGSKGLGSQGQLRPIRPLVLQRPKLRALDAGGLLCFHLSRFSILACTHPGMPILQRRSPAKGDRHLWFGGREQSDCSSDRLAGTRRKPRGFALSCFLFRNLTTGHRDPTLFMTSSRARACNFHRSLCSPPPLPSGLPCLTPVWPDPICNNVGYTVIRTKYVLPREGHARARPWLHQPLILV